MVIIVRTAIHLKFIFQKQSLIKEAIATKNNIAKNGDMNIKTDFINILCVLINSSSSNMQLIDIKTSLSYPVPHKG